MANNSLIANRVTNIWDDNNAPEGEVDLLVYRSNLLGTDLAVTNRAGGNTSVKVDEKDPLTGEDVRVMYVKGSGGDLRTITRDGFAAVVMPELERVYQHYPGIDREDDMVDIVKARCIFNGVPARPSIDTPLHGLLKHTHIDHTHPDAIIAIACSQKGEAITKEAFGGRLGWVDWKRPGFDLGVDLRRLVEEHPELEGIVLGGHGLFTWGEDARSCYDKTIEVIQQGEQYIEAEGVETPFRSAGVTTLGPMRKDRFLSNALPVIRGVLSEDESKILHVDTSKVVRQFVDSEEVAALANQGTSCPDHFITTKQFPLLIEDPNFDDADAFEHQLRRAVQGYLNRYEAYYEEHGKGDGITMRDPYPHVILIPGLGMITSSSSKDRARTAAEFFTNAINVMRGAEAIDKYQGLSLSEAARVEYWLLEQRKLDAMPAPAPLHGKVACVTGGANGIGLAISQRLLDEGAHVAVTDIRPDLNEVVEELSAEYGSRVFGVAIDVSSVDSVTSGMHMIVREYGGVDILVNNAGWLPEENYGILNTPMEVWEKCMDVNAKGYKLATAAAAKVMVEQRGGVEGRDGGSIVFIGSKNAVAPTDQSLAYNVSKAAGFKVMYEVANELGVHGIRCHGILPDGVFGTGMWPQERIEQRAAAYGCEPTPEGVAAHLASRTLLGEGVTPEAVAHTVYHSLLIRDTTASVITVDGGNPLTFR